MSGGHAYLMRVAGLLLFNRKMRIDQKSGDHIYKMYGLIFIKRR
jgi:hypothetical protein